MFCQNGSGSLTSGHGGRPAGPLTPAAQSQASGHYWEETAPESTHFPEKGLFQYLYYFNTDAVVPILCMYFRSICTQPRRTGLGAVCSHRGITAGPCSAGRHEHTRLRLVTDGARDGPEHGCAVIRICEMLYFQVVFIFNFQGLFLVLEEGTFAKNTALNHVSSILVTFEFPHLSVCVPGPAPTPGPQLSLAPA